MSEKISVLIVSNEEKDCQSIKTLLEREASIEVIGTTRSVEEGIEIVGNTAPNVVVMDFNLSEMSGLAATEAIRQGSFSQVILLSDSKDPIQIRDAMRSGAHDCLPKLPSLDELLSSLRKAHQKSILEEKMMQEARIECPNCGKINYESDVFCQDCWQRLKPADTEDGSYWRSGVTPVWLKGEETKAFVSGSGKPLKVFLCHSSDDKAAVRRLYRELRSQKNIDPWLDEEKLLPGEDWALEIEKAVEGAHVIIVCLSETSINKEGFVQKEIAYALDVALEKPEGTIFIIPLRLNECKVPRNLSRWQWVDYFREGSFEKLISALSKRAEKLGIEIG